MNEIRFGDYREEVDLAGRTVFEAREQLRSDFDIRDSDRALVNGRKIRRRAERDTVLAADDTLAFDPDRHNGLLLAGLLLLALAITGGIFAYGFINSSTTLNATVVETNFADVTVHPDAVNITWLGFGFFKGSIGGPNGLFIVTPGTGYTGDLVITVSIGNADQLAKRYRTLALRLDIVDPTGTPVDINESGAADANDWVLLTLDNASVSLFPDGSASSLTVRVVNGYYVTHVRPLGGWQGSASPDIFCEVAQR